MPPPRTRLLFWSILLLAVVAPVVLVEGWLRFQGLGRPVLYYTNASFRYAPVPDQRVRRRRGASVTIDAFGFRGIEDWGADADYRVLFVGNSVTWSGTFIDDTESFPHLTCEALERRRSARFTCGNAGVNAYGTDNMAARLRAEAPRDADAIVVTLIADDAIRGLVDINALPFFTRPPPGPLPAITEVVAFGMFHLARRLRFDASARDPSDQVLVARHSLEALFEVLREAEAAGTHVLLVFSPVEEQAVGGPGEGAAGEGLAREGQAREDLTREVRAAMAGSGLPFLDMTTTVQGYAGRDLYYDGVHLEVGGHRLYAEAIASALLGLFVPDERTEVEDPTGDPDAQW